MNRVAAIAATLALAAGMYCGWFGLRLGTVEWSGVAALIGGTWLWDLRWPLLPAYVVAALWGVERIAASLSRRF